MFKCVQEEEAQPLLCLQKCSLLNGIAYHSLACECSEVG